jgi:transglutaminase-like putative cysteine protease
MRFRVSHSTRYHYAEPVSLCHSLLHLKPPRQFPRQTCLASQIRVDPWPAVNREHEDFFGNRVSYFSIQQAHSILEVTATSEVEVHAPDPGLLVDSLPWETARERLREHRGPALARAGIYVLPSPLAPVEPAAVAFAAVSFTPRRPIVEGAVDLMGRIFREFEYDPHFTTVSTPVAEVMRHRRGVCQDFAHLAIAGLRGLGLAARYVSGYLETLPPPGQVKLQGSDASHAWFSILVPELGWVDFDPTNDLIPGEQHIVTAVGRDYQDVTPMRGIFYGGGGHELTVAVDVNRIADEAAPA